MSDLSDDSTIEGHDNDQTVQEWDGVSDWDVGDDVRRMRASSLPNRGSDGSTCEGAEVGHGRFLHTRIDEAHRNFHSYLSSQSLCDRLIHPFL